MRLPKLFTPFHSTSPQRRVRRCSTSSPLTSRLSSPNTISPQESEDRTIMGTSLCSTRISISGYYQYCSARNPTWHPWYQKSLPKSDCGLTVRLSRRQVKYVRKPKLLSLNLSNQTYLLTSSHSPRAGSSITDLLTTTRQTK